MTDACRNCKRHESVHFDIGDKRLCPFAPTEWEPMTEHEYITYYDANMEDYNRVLTERGLFFHKAMNS